MFTACLEVVDMFTACLCAAVPFKLCKFYNQGSTPPLPFPQEKEMLPGHGKLYTYNNFRLFYFHSCFRSWSLFRSNARRGVLT